MTSQAPKHRISRRAVVLNVLILIVLIAVLGTQLDGLTGSWDALRTAGRVYLLFAACAVILGYIAAAGSYVFLAAPKVSLPSALVVQIASGFANRLLPAGLGSLGLFTAYLHRRGLTVAESSALVITNNILGAVGSVLLTTLILISHPQFLALVRLGDIRGVLVMILVVAAFISAVWLFLSRSSGKRRTIRMQEIVRSSLRALRTSLHPDKRTAGALICNMLLTSLNAAVLYFCVLSVGSHLTWPEAVIVLSLGTAVGAVVPTPGGIGGVEAGLLAGLTAFGVSASPGLAAVLLYRLATYWLPVIPGLLVFRTVEKNYI